MDKNKNKNVLFKGVITELENGEFMSDFEVKFKNLSIRGVIPKKNVLEWGLKVGDKVFVHIEKGGKVLIFKDLKEMIKMSQTGQS